MSCTHAHVRATPAGRFRCDECDAERGYGEGFAPILPPPASPHPCRCGHAREKHNALGWCGHGSGLCPCATWRPMTECARCRHLYPAGALDDELCRGCEEYVAAEVSRDREATCPGRGA
jgi:hypothetical protein